MKLKILCILLLLLPMSSMAQKVAYAVFKDFTLTFYYNDKKPQGAYDVENLIQVPGYFREHPEKLPSPYRSPWIQKNFTDYYYKEWDSVHNQIKTIVFDKSFKEYIPKNCSHWFARCNNLTSIKGIKNNLNTSEATNNGVYVFLVFKPYKP